MILGKKAVVALTGVSGRQVEYWALTGVVKPSVPAAGKGTRRGYSFKDLVGLKVAKRLKDVGIQPTKNPQGPGVAEAAFPRPKAAFCGTAILNRRRNCFLSGPGPGPGKWPRPVADARPRSGRAGDGCRCCLRLPPQNREKCPRNIPI